MALLIADFTSACYNFFDKSEFANAKRHGTMVDKRYYEKLGGFSYLLSELRKKLGEEQTDVLVHDAVNLCNELCDKYSCLSKKGKDAYRTDDLPASRYLSADDSIYLA